MMNAKLRYFMRLYKQQFWLFGWDCRRPEGNTLVEMGFERTPVPIGERVKSSRYHCVLEDGTVLTLWSFGVCWSSPGMGSIYVSRLKPRPLYSSDSAFVPEAWQPDRLGMFGPPQGALEMRRANKHLHKLLTWFGRYEEAVLQRYGSAYRQLAIDSWRDPVGDGFVLPEFWARQCAIIESEFSIASV